MNDDYYIIGREAMEHHMGGEETVVKTYRECNPKNVVVPSHDYLKHNYYAMRNRLCPYCSAGSCLVVEVVKE